MSPDRARMILLSAVCLMAMCLLFLMAVRAPAQSCDREPNGHAIVVNLSNTVNRETIEHAREAVAAGQPRYLHWRPDLADANRAVSLRGRKKVPGRDLDEYPPAATAEGGRGADVKAIDRSDNRSAGSRMGAIMRPYCNNQAFILEP